MRVPTTPTDSASQQTVPPPDADISLPVEAATWSSEKRTEVVAIARVLLGKGAKQGGRPKLAAYTFRELLHKRFDEGHALLGGSFLDRGGAFVVAGVQKVGKSFLAIQAALSILTSRPFLNVPPPRRDPNAVQPVSALMLQGELSERGLKDRLLRTVAHYANPPDGATPAELRYAERAHDMSVVFTHHHIKLDDPESLVWLAEMLYDHGSAALPAYGKPHHVPDVLVLDPFAWFHSLDENSTQEMARVCGVLDRLRHGLGIAVIVIHHAAKGSMHQQNTGHKMRGSTVLAGWYETFIALEWKDKVGGPRKMSFEMRNGQAPDEMIAVFDPNRNCLVQVDDADYNPLDYTVLLALTDPVDVNGEELRAALDDGLALRDLNKRIAAVNRGHRLKDRELYEAVLHRMLDAGFIEVIDDPRDAEKRAARKADTGQAGGRTPRVWRITDAGIARLPVLRTLFDQQKQTADLAALLGDTFDDDDNDTPNTDEET